MLCFLLGVVASYDLSLNDMTCFTSPSMNFTAFFIIHYFNLILQGFAELFFSAQANFVDFPKYASPHMCNSAKKSAENSAEKAENRRQSRPNRPRDRIFNDV